MTLGLGRQGKVRKRKGKPPKQTKVNYHDDDDEPPTKKTCKSPSASKISTGLRFIDIDLLLLFIQQFGCTYCKRSGEIELKKEVKLDYSQSIILNVTEHTYEFSTCEKTRLFNKCEIC